MRRRISVFFLFTLLFTSTTAFATWSVIAVNTATGEIVVASATCLTQKDLDSIGAADLREVQAVVVPAAGAAMLQASIEATGRNKALVYRLLRDGAAPELILEQLGAADGAIPTRQIGILDLKGRSVGFTGRRTVGTALSQGGRVDRIIYYQIQGNILRSEAVIQDAVGAFQRSGGTLSDRVMSAMEAADAAGGDRRCTGGKTAETAYIWILDGKGKETAYINVTDENISPAESLNPVRTLRMRYDKRPQ